MVYGGTPPTELVHEKLSDVAIGSKKSLQSCLLGYAALGWSGYVPAACRKGMMLVPLNFAPWLWGWPHKFQQRMQSAGVDVFVLEQGIAEIADAVERHRIYLLADGDGRHNWRLPAIARRAAQA